MKKIVLLYGLSMALLILLLQWMDYRLFVRDISMEVYIGLIAVLFTGLGIWMGLRFTRPKVVALEQAPVETLPSEEKRKASGISQREFEVLELMAQGLSNQEIADRLFISLNTVKTHASKLFSKLEVKRRTQAIQEAKKLGLLP